MALPDDVWMLIVGTILGIGDGEMTAETLADSVAVICSRLLIPASIDSLNVGSMGALLTLRSSVMVDAAAAW